ncbi:MAG: GAF and HD-GYP domain-containing protein, partial [Pseudomonadales bacterium]
MSIHETPLHRLIDIGIALSAEKDATRLMEAILLEARSLTNADGGTLYIRTEGDELAFQIVRNDTLGIARGGTTGEVIDLPSVPMYLADGSPNLRHLVSNAALEGRVLNVADAYECADFDLSGTKSFDARTGYRTRSVLTLPMKNHQGQVIGVLQLLNAQDAVGKVIGFAGDLQHLVEALASQAAVALDNALLLEAQDNLLDSFIALIARAIDAKSPYTGGHCERVPVLAKMLAGAACEADSGPFADFNLTREEWRELHLAAWLHDCGKVTTPDYVVDKATKLETITDRIHEIRMRFEVIKREKTIAYLQQLLAGEGDPEELQAELDKALAQLDDDFHFIAECNLGGESMAAGQEERIKRIAAMTWTRTLDDRAGVS